MNMMILGVFNVVDDILNFIRDILQGWVLSNLEDMFNILNEKTAGIVTELTTSPDDWQGGTIWTLIEKIAENVALPIAGTFLTLVIIWDLLNMLTAGNNFGDVDVLSVIVKWLLKSMVAAWFIANSLKICTCFLEIGVWMVKKTKNVFSSQVASVASGDQSDQLMLFFNTYFTADEDATSSLIGQLLGLGILTMIMCLVMKVMGVLITIVLYSRMISIYMHCSMCPIPAAMLLNPHLNQIGYGYYKNVFALALQGVTMMICVAIYGVLVGNILDVSSVTVSSQAEAIAQLNSSILEAVGLSILLVMTLFKSENVTKSILGIQ